MEKSVMAGEKICSLLMGLLLLAAGTLSLFYWGNKKQVWFCDEIYTYESANGFEQEWPAAYVDQWMTGEDVEAFFAADWDRLSLNDITVRLYNDHVPLYFWLFRMVSFFFFRGSGTVWIGLLMNLLFYLIFLALGYLLFLRLTGSPLTAGVVMLLSCVANRLVIEQITVLRMYMMLLLAQLLLLLGGFWMLREAERHKMPWGAFPYLLAVSVFGFLTHYDYWVFYAAGACCFCLWLLASAVRRNGKRFWAAWEFRYAAIWVINFGLSLLATIWLFPYCRWNLNRGKGQTALKSLFVFTPQKRQQIAWGYERLSESLFGGAVPAAAGLLLVFGCIGGGLFLLYKKKEYKKLAVLCITVLTAQLYQLAVCFTMPDAWEERYLWGSFTLMLLCAVWGGVLLVQGLLAKMIGQASLRTAFRRVAVLALCAGFLMVQIGVIDGGQGVAYLFHPEKDVALLREHKEQPWIVYGPTVGVYSYYDWLIPEHICFLTQDNTLEDGAAVREIGEESFVLYIYEDYLPEALDFFEQEMGRELEARYLTKSTNLTVYLVE